MPKGNMICPELIHLLGVGFYITNKAFTLKFPFSLDPPNSQAITAAELSEFGTLARAQALAAPSCGGSGVARCSQEAVQGRRLESRGSLGNNKESQKQLARSFGGY